MPHMDAMRAVISEFVNFDLPTHKMLELANNTGFLWFSKYQLRILGVMGRSLKEQPFEAVATYGMSQMLGMANIFGSIPGLTKGAFQNFGTAFSTMTESVPNTAVINMIDSTADTLI